MEITTLTNEKGQTINRAVLDNGLITEPVFQIGQEVYYQANYYRYKEWQKRTIINIFYNVRLERWEYELDEYSGQYPVEDLRTDEQYLIEKEKQDQDENYQVCKYKEKIEEQILMRTKGLLP